MTQIFPTAIQLGLVPGFALQDGDLLAKLLASASSFGAGPTVAGSVSGTGTTAADATQLTSSVNLLTTLTATNNAVKLPNIPASTMIRIYNNSTVVAHIFPPDLNQSIDTAAAGAAVQLAPGARCDYLYLGDDRWVSDLLGSPSA